MLNELENCSTFSNWNLVIVSINEQDSAAVIRRRSKKCEPTRIFCGTIHILILTVSGSKWCSRGNTLGLSKASNSLKIYDFPFPYGPASTQHTRDLHIGNVMKHILISIEKTLVVVNHSLKLRFKKSHQLIRSAYKGIYQPWLQVDQVWYFDIMMLGANWDTRFT